ncbi:hypothetical protein [Paraburkholderia sp. J63]|uniref:hypothetical protein n=1 Tax=Paraburkholderia sp. J63 TaxID=2805434 RepID=UPI002ABE19FE|nr:hypothetical protein [Paraburkholderia sp. J63]
MNTEQARSRLTRVAAIATLAAVGVVCAMALLKIFGDAFGLAALIAFIVLAVHAWRHTDTEVQTQALAAPPPRQPPNKLT